MIPNYVFLARLGWLNTLAALVVPQVAAAFAIILLRQYMKGFPSEPFDAWPPQLWSVRVSSSRRPHSG
jgi:ABC-type glycerol-3-phosphate transport system permease component